MTFKKANKTDDFNREKEREVGGQITEKHTRLEITKSKIYRQFSFKPPFHFGMSSEEAGQWMLPWHITWTSHAKSHRTCKEWHLLKITSVLMRSAYARTNQKRTTHAHDSAHAKYKLKPLFKIAPIFLNDLVTHNVIACQERNRKNYEIFNGFSDQHSFWHWHKFGQLFKREVRN